MTVLERIRTDDGDLVVVGYNGTSIEITSGDTVYMVRPETLVEILKENPERIGKEVFR